jgi:glycosyltransferase involved in cell wall biosynthesis
MKLSIIIPFYNSEKYIVRCIDSIYNENIPENEFEVICIDDFSKDNSVNLIKTYSLIHSNIILLSHSKNKKQGAARNLGIKKAKGEYVWFVDSDDFIEKDIIKVLFLKLETSKPDILQFNAKTLTTNEVLKHDVFLDFPINNLTGIEYLKYEMFLNYENRIRAVWSKWYKREFLINFNLFFEEGIFWEDVNHTLKAFYYAPHFMYFPVFGYNYVETPNSDFRGKQTARKFIDTIQFCLKGLKFLSENNFDKDLKIFIGKRFVSTINKYKSKTVELDFCEFMRCILKLNMLNFKILSQFMSYNQYSWLFRRSEFLCCWLKRFQ